MTGEARLERTDAGLVPADPGWFVMNAREARWIKRDRQGHNVPLTGWTEEEAEGLFPQLGMARRHGASPDDPEDPYARFADSEPTPYRDGWLPDR